VRFPGPTRHGSGLWVCAKRLERGRFRWPAVESEQQKVVLTAEELALLLGGIDLSQAERRRWHRVLASAEEDIHIKGS
jgi:transposase